MKKIVLVFAVAAFLASCGNNAGDAEQRMKDSLDSITNLKTQSIEEAAENAKDTIEKRADSIKERIDSVAENTRDSLKGTK